MKSRVSLEQVNVRHATVRTSSRAMTGRASLILGLQTEHGEFFGEACPLKGFGSDFLESAESELKSVTSHELERTVVEVCAAFRTIQDLSDAHRLRLFDGPQHPISVLESCSARFCSASARHCFETVVMDAAAHLCGVPALRLLAATPVAPFFKTSTVLDLFAADFLAQARAACQRGVGAIKLKCGRDLARECAVLRTLAAALDQHSPLRVRLDVNQGFHADECLELVDAGAGLDLDWIEDPTASWEQWRQLQLRTEVNLAIDEALLELEPDQLSEVSAQVVILKPMALGGWSRCLRFAAAARAQNKSISLSHFFDGPIAMDAAISLAFALQSPEFVPGLGYHAALPGHLPRSARALSGEELRIVEARA